MNAKALDMAIAALAAAASALAQRDTPPHNIATCACMSCSVARSSIQAISAAEVETLIATLEELARRIGVHFFDRSTSYRQQ